MASVSNTGNQDIASPQTRGKEQSETGNAFSEQHPSLLQKETLNILNRTAEDPTFLNNLMKYGVNALEGYQISSEAKQAIASADLQWINEHVGMLTQKQLIYIYKKLGNEAW